MNESFQPLFLPSHLCINLLPNFYSFFELILLPRCFFLVFLFTFSFICCLGWYEKHQLTTVNFLSKQNALLGVIFRFYGDIYWNECSTDVSSKKILFKKRECSSGPMSAKYWFRCRCWSSSSVVEAVDKRRLFQTFSKYSAAVSIRTVIGPGSFPRRDHPRTLSNQK